MILSTDELIREALPQTMIPVERVVENVGFITNLLCERSLPDGMIIECGVWRGGMAFILATLFGEDRRYRFFDSFEGLPPPSKNDGEDAHHWAKKTEHPRYFDNCRALEDEVRHFLNSRLLKHSKLEISGGWFAEKLKFLPDDRIAFAHLDADWYDSTLLCLERIWNNMQPNGIILIDDYYDWEGCRRAVHDFLSRHRAREAIRQVGNAGSVYVRKLGEWRIEESPHLL